MSKAKEVPLMLVVQNGHLVPASAYDQEQIDKYKNGARIEATAWQGRNSSLTRKFFAIVGLCLKQCKTPWKSTDEAVDALKMASGLTEMGKTAKGKYFLRPGSISFAKMDEAEFQEFYDLAMAVLEQVTGVDPTTLKKEASDTGLHPGDDYDLETGELIEDEEEVEDPLAMHAVDPAAYSNHPVRYFWHGDSGSLFFTEDGSDGTEGDPLCIEIDKARYDEIRAELDAEDNVDSSTEDSSEPPGIASQFAAEVAKEAAAETAQGSEKAAFQVETDKIWLQGITKFLWAATNPGLGKEGMELLATQKRVSREGYPADNITEATRNKATSIYKALQVIVDSGEYGDNLKYIEGLSGLRFDPKKKGA